jgi:hypothetical protein
MAAWLMPTGSKLQTSPTCTIFASSQAAYTIRNLPSFSRETVIITLSALKIGAIGADAGAVGLDPPEEFCDPGISRALARSPPDEATSIGGRP